MKKWTRGICNLERLPPHLNSRRQKVASKSIRMNFLSTSGEKPAQHGAHTLIKFVLEEDTTNKTLDLLLSLFAF
jgi:hypothetical protein